MKSTPGFLDFGTDIIPSTLGLVSQPLWVDQEMWFGVQIFWTGDPVGNWFLQGSMDKGQVNLQKGLVTQVTNWTGIANSIVPATGVPGNLCINFDTGVAAFRYARVVYDATSGSGLITSATFSMKGF